MKARATTRISIFRGNMPADDYGDVEPDDTTALYTGIPASVIERTQHVFTADSPEPTIIRYTTCRVGAEHDVRVGDRIKDEWSGIHYTMDSYVKPNSPVNSPDIRINIKRIT